MGMVSINKMNNTKGKFLKKLLPVFLVLVSIHSYSQIPLFRETVWLQTTSGVYLAGEEIHFKASVMEIDTYKPSSLSNNLRVELINNKGELIYRDNYELRRSRLTSSIKLPDGLPSGNYHLRSYTNWMRNFPESEFAWLSLRVIQPSDLGKQEYRYKHDSISIMLTPTGPGNQGTQGGECSIFTSDTEGRPLSAEGFILSSSTDTVAWISTDKTGWGTSKYNKGNESGYKPFIRGYDPAKTMLSLHETAREEPIMTLRDDRSFVYLDIKNLPATGNYKLLVHQTYSWYWYSESHTVTGNIEFAVPQSSLPNGIVQFSLLNNTNELLSARLWSDQKPGDKRARILNHDTHAELRRNYIADYQINTSSPGKQSNINVLVIKDNPGYTAGNYIPGLPGWYAGYRLPGSEDSFRAWLMNNTYPDKVVKEFFREDNIPGPGLPFASTGGIQIGYLPETQNGMLSGRLINNNDSTGIGEIYLGLTILNDNTFHTSITDKKGYFLFTFPGITGSADYIINFIREPEPGWEIKIDEIYESVSYIPPAPPLKFTEDELVYLQEQAELMQLKNIYGQSGSTRNNNNASRGINHSLASFYGKPDLRVVVDKYIRLSNLREVFYEVVPHVSIRNKGDKSIPVITGDYLYPAPYPSLILFDGIPVYDLSEILKLPPGRIKSIELINQFYIHGNDFFSGILNIESVNGDFGGLDLPATSILGSIDFPAKAGTDRIKVKSKRETNQPVLDNILLWDSILPGDSGVISYTTGDNPGKYNIILYGYDESGNWVSTSESFVILPFPPH